MNGRVPNANDIIVLHAAIRCFGARNGAVHAKRTLPMNSTVHCKDNMNIPVDPKKFGLPPSTKLRQIGQEHYAIIVERKSRIIAKDGERILAKVAKIKASVTNARVDVKTTAPICNKTKNKLQANHVKIDPL